MLSLLLVLSTPLHFPSLPPAVLTLNARRNLLVYPQRLNTLAKDKLSTLHVQGIKWHVMHVHPSIHSSLTCLHHPGCLGNLLLSPRGEFGFLAS